MTCQLCGHENVDGTRFCASCGVFLAYAPPATAPRTGRDAGHEVHGARPATSGPAPPRGPWAPPGAGGEAGARPPPAAAAGTSRAAAAAWGPPQRASSADGRPGEGPPSEDRVTPRRASTAPALHHPTGRIERPVALRPTPRPTTPDEEAVLCGACGLGNAPSRRFCARCAAPLSEVSGDAPSRPLPWWRRVLRPRRAQRPPQVSTQEGGPEPTLHDRLRRRRRIQALAAAAVAALVVGVAVLPAAAPVRQRLGLEGSAAADWLRGLVADPRPVRPVGFAATSTGPRREPRFAADGMPSTFWTEGAPEDGVGEALLLEFAEPVRLDHVIVSSGGVDPGVAFTSHPRPRVLRFESDLEAGGSNRRDVELDDRPGPQTFDLGLRIGSTLTVRIVSTHPSAGAGRETSISELEFFRRG